MKGSAADTASLREDDELAALSIYSDADHEAVVTTHRDGKAMSIRYFPRGKCHQVVQFHPFATYMQLV